MLIKIALPGLMVFNQMLNRLRRILYSLTAVYVSNDYRLCNDSVWQSLMGCRLGSAAPSEAGLSTLVWSGAQPPWWLTDDTSAVKWHMPSEEEVRGSGRGCLWWDVLTSNCYYLVLTCSYMNL
jgi:hypothetical protein